MSRECLKSNVIKVIDNVAQESLSKKYYDAFLSELEDVTVEAMPLFMNGILIKDNKSNEILVYIIPLSDVVVVESRYSDGFEMSNKLVFENNEWLIV